MRVKAEEQHYLLKLLNTANLYVIIVLSVSKKEKKEKKSLDQEHTAIDHFATVL